MKKVLLFPGAFNPPHNGHVSALQIVLKKMSFDEIWIMPSGNRTDKTIPISYEDRRDLGSLFVEYLQTKISIPVRLITDELDDPEWRKTEDILREVRRQPNIRCAQLIGLDGYMKIREKSPDETFAIIRRPGCEISPHLIRNGDAVILDEMSPDISSTHIRALIKNKDPSYKELVPEKISRYITEHHLYQ